MARIDFALWDAVGGYSSSSTSMADVYDEHITLARELDAAGWHSYFVIEHQNSPVGRITAPTVFLTAVARATERLRIGAMMWQLPFYHPIRLAQEVAMLDQLSRGRVEFGTGIGVHEHEFIRWDVDYYQRAAIAGEVLEIVKQAWTRDEVTFEGKYFRFNEALPQPKPYQQPHPPIWAAVHSDQAIEFAARNNYHVSQNLDTDEVIARKFDLYRKIWTECGHAGPMPRVFLMRQVHVAETDAKAHEEARLYLASREGGAVPVGGGPLEKTRIGWGTHARGMGRDRAARRQGAWRDHAACARQLRVQSRTGARAGRQPGHGHPQARGGQAPDRLRHLLHQPRDRCDAGGPRAQLDQVVQPRGRSRLQMTRRVGACC